MNQPLISVIIPVYNGEKYIAQAIESVLNQNYKAIELIVIDDGSTDGTAKVVKNYLKIIYFYQSNKGSGAARNQGVRLAKGQYIAFLDADDYWLPEKLINQLEALSTVITPSMMFCAVEQFICPQLPHVVASKIKIPYKILPGYCASALLIHKDCYSIVGDFIESHEVGEFIDWFARAQDKKFNLVNTPEVLVKRRLHDNNMGKQKQKYSQQGYLSVLKKALDRRREMNVE